MFLFSTRNAVLVALMQVGLLVAGVLSAAVSYKWCALSGIITPLPTIILMDYGVLLLVLPLAWIGIVLRLRKDRELPEDIKNAAFLSGILILVLGVVFIAYAVLVPWFNVDWGIGGAVGTDA